MYKPMPKCSLHQIYILTSKKSQDREKRNPNAMETQMKVEVNNGWKSMEWQASERNQ
ncbi:hypothetical protein LINPERPRIM_LOCUS734, partial [Linum perenne]